MTRQEACQKSTTEDNLERFVLAPTYRSSTQGLDFLCEFDEIGLVLIERHIAGGLLIIVAELYGLVAKPHPRNFLYSHLW